MAADSTEIVDRVLQLEGGFKTLSELVTGPSAATSTVASMALRVFREILALRRRLLELLARCLGTAAGCPTNVEPTCAPSSRRSSPVRSSP